MSRGNRQKQLTVFEGIVAERDVSCCKKTQTKAFCLYLQVYAYVFVWVAGCLWEKERKKENSRKIENSAKRAF